MGTLQGPLIFLLLFLIYMVPLHMTIPRGVMLSYLYDLSLHVPSDFHTGNIRHLQVRFTIFSKKAQR